MSLNCKYDSFVQEPCMSISGSTYLPLYNAKVKYILCNTVTFLTNSLHPQYCFRGTERESTYLRYAGKYRTEVGSRFLSRRKALYGYE
ncbi:hypothetical protein CEXT_441631 [Caerostris extrusa]|uniref:Uncharacterized protein n=1 Tax=Caerostris extrusa TaxID=172846 RepID=A0AAV4XA32_CAEEX|nr:hypothetical protein CEXT_441631 [Caerostris extrusa]